MIYEAIRSGLDFCLKHQVVNENSADYGRFPLLYDVKEKSIESMSTNWETGVMIEVMLIAYKFLKDDRYLSSAEMAVNYLKSLQVFSPFDDINKGVFREITPQTNWAHPRDALTAAWALLDFSITVNDKEAFTRSKLYADWFCDIGIEKGYPYWTVRFDDEPWSPEFCGSFHSGGAFYFGKLYKVTGEKKYFDVMCQILDFYNKNHLDEHGQISVVLDRITLEILDGRGLTTRWWEEMHIYNDDFGTLANLFAYSLTKKTEYLDASKYFLKRMSEIQRCDGGFGPDNYSVPSAAGVVVVEMLKAKDMGCSFIGDAVINRAVERILEMQEVSYGVFLSEGNKSNIRTGAYSLMALLRAAGAKDEYYSF
ncbi:MAG: hypothetical protein ACIAQZ_09855 [Sedimentisphaeraceae bacterium JB056]